MFKSADIQRTALSVAAALVFSVTMVTAAVGPVKAAVPQTSVQSASPVLY